MIYQTGSKKLLDARKEDKGWTYFLSQDGRPDILPTAFAVLALSRVGVYQQQIARQVDWLKESALEQRHDQQADIIETFVRIFCIFALAYRQDDLPKEEVKVLRRAFEKQWKLTEALLDQDLEQNIEYSRGEKNYYVRVPWQLYLLTLAARLNPRRLWSFSAQRSLERMLNAVQSSTGFRYPYSGASLSSRTNAILFDALDRIRRSTKGGGLRGFFYAVDRGRTALSNQFIWWGSLVIGVGGVSFCVYSWMTKSGKPEDLGRSLTSSIIMLAVSYFLEKVRKTR